MSQNNTMSKYKILLPWLMKDWGFKKEKLLQPITNIIDFDSRVAALQRNFRPRQMADALARFFETDNLLLTKEHFIGDIVPMLQKMITEGPKTFKNSDCRLLMPLSNTNVSLNRLQIATIMACLLFGLIDVNRKKTKKKVNRKFDPMDIQDHNFQDLSFHYGFLSQNNCFIYSIMNYFDRIHTIWAADPTVLKKGIIIYKRYCSHDKLDLSREIKISEVQLGDGTIDDSDAKLHVAFAHNIIGGENIFGGILSQEELTLLSRPELIPICLFCPEIAENESIIAFGAERMNSFKGFGGSTSFTGNFNDNTPRGGNDEKLLQTGIIFINSTTKTSSKDICIKYFERDIYKAYIGFSSIKFNTRENIATGNWIYGFNSTNIYVKFIQQLVAASFAGVDLIYYTNNRDVEIEISRFAEWLSYGDINCNTLLSLYKQVMYNAMEDDSVKISDLNIFNEIMDL